MMLENILFILLGTALLLFGIYLSAAFAGIRFTRKNFFILFGVCVLCGGLQLIVLTLYDVDMVWKSYPLTTHIPLILCLCAVYRKKILTALISVFTVYLCCQTSKWFGVLIFSITNSSIIEYFMRIFILIVIFFTALKLFTPVLSEIYNGNTRKICIFGIMPAVYYLFDYGTIVYTDLWLNNNRVVAEFLPFFLGIVYMIFCMVYYREYEQKADAERKENILRITMEQRRKHFEAVKQSEAEIRLLRHDMRLFLNNLAVCIGNGETKKAAEMISAYVSIIEHTKVEHFCANDTLNYVLTAFSAQFKAQQIAFIHTIQIGELHTDEILFSSILSNALDNAQNAQMELPQELRWVRLMLKMVEGKLLLSVKNPVKNTPVFSDGLPISNKKGHGYGTQSIRYMTERLGGNCQFSAEENVFTLRVIL